MDKKQFILDTLLPYKEDRSQCAIFISENKSVICKYINEEGKKCAVGKHLIEGEHQKFQGTVEQLDNKYSLQKILTKEANNQDFSLIEWTLMQEYHDGIALEKGTITMNATVLYLEEETGLELDELKFAS